MHMFSNHAGSREKRNHFFLFFLPFQRQTFFLVMTVAPSNQVASHCSSTSGGSGLKTHITWLHSVRSCQGGGNKMMARYWPTKVNTKTRFASLSTMFRIAAIIPEQTFPGSDVIMETTCLFARAMHCGYPCDQSETNVGLSVCIFSKCTVVYPAKLVRSSCLVAVLHFPSFLDV